MVQKIFLADANEVDPAAKSYLGSKRSLWVEHQGRHYRQFATSQHALSYKERAYKTLQLVAKIALGMLLMGIPFTSSPYRQSLGQLFQEATAGSEKNIYYRERLLSFDVVKEMKEGLDQLNFNPVYVNHFLLINQGEGKEPLRLQFILKNKENAPFNRQALLQQIDQIEKILERLQVSTASSSYNFHWTFLFKSGDTPALYQGVGGFQSCDKGEAFSTKRDRKEVSTEALLQWQKAHALRYMGFSSEQIVEADGEILPTPFFHSL